MTERLLWGSLAAVPGGPRTRRPASRWPETAETQHTSYGVALLPKYTVLGMVARGDLVALFPRLRLLEDWFCIYQKRTSAGREKNRVVAEFLLRLDVTEFGDAIRGPGP